MIDTMVITMEDYTRSAVKHIDSFKWREQIEILDMALKGTLTQYMYCVDRYHDGEWGFEDFNRAVNEILGELIILDAILNELVPPSKKFAGCVPNEGFTLQ